MSPPEAARAMAAVLRDVELVLVPGSGHMTSNENPEPVAAARYVVQVGAFTEKRALAEALSRVERLGLKTYTQVIESPAGPRTRVRVGPFSSRAEADAVGAKLKAAARQNRNDRRRRRRKKTRTSPSSRFRTNESPFFNSLEWKKT